MSVAQRLARLLALLGFIGFVSIVGIRCSGGNSSSTTGPTAPSRAPAAFVITAFEVTFSQDATTRRYVVHLAVRETAGQTGGTMGVVEFTLMKDGAGFATASVDNAWQTAHVNGGGAMDARTITVTDSDMTRPIASRISVKINFVDDDQRSGTLTQATDVPQPPTLNPPAPPPATTYTLSCIVQDDGTNAGLSDALVQILNGANAGKSTSSTAGGQCSLGGLVAGTFTVRVTRSGYQTLDKDVTLPNDSRIEFKLTSNAPPPSGGGGGGGGSGSMICAAPVPGNSSCANPTAKCNDGTPSCSQNRSGTCSSHGGVACWVCPGVLCSGIRAPDNSMTSVAGWR
jgi:hypothetical protein